MDNIRCHIIRCDIPTIYIMAYSRKSALSLYIYTYIYIYLFQCFNICYIACQDNFKLCWASQSCRCCSWSVWQSYSANTIAEPLQSCTKVATAELHQLIFCSDMGVRVSPLQAAAPLLQPAPDQFKFQVSLVTSVLGHVRVRALPIVLSESRYMTSVQHSKSVVVRLSDSDHLPT